MINFTTENDSTGDYSSKTGEMLLRWLVNTVWESESQQDCNLTKAGSVVNSFIAANKKMHQVRNRSTGVFREPLLLEFQHFLKDRK